MKNIIVVVCVEKFFNEMLLIDSDIFVIKNEIEILFGLWVREYFIIGC